MWVCDIAHPYVPMFLKPIFQCEFVTSHTPIYVPMFLMSIIQYKFVTSQIPVFQFLYFNMSLWHHTSLCPNVSNVYISIWVCVVTEFLNYSGILLLLISELWLAARVISDQSAINLTSTFPISFNVNSVNSSRFRQLFCWCNLAYLSLLATFQLRTRYNYI